MTSLSFVVLVSVLGVFAFGQEQPPPPPFLQGQPQSVIDSFHSILQSGHGLTDTQLDQKVDQWVSTQSAQIKSRYSQFKAELKSHQSNAEAAHQAAVAKFSAQAKAADAKLSAIANNPSLTAAQKNSQIESIVNSLPANVRQEIEAAMQG